MKNLRLFCLLGIVLFVIAQPGFAQEQGNSEHDNFSVALLAGYTVLPMMVNSIDWARYEGKKESIDASDDSYLMTAPLYGLALTYFPSEGFITPGFTIEGFYQSHQGQLKGAFGNIQQTQKGYDFHMAMDYYQLNFLCSLYFLKTAFRPYLQIGMGAVRSDAEFESYHQTAYGVSGIIAWGAQYTVNGWFAFGAQARTQDLFGLTYFYEPYETTLLTIESQFIPLSFLAHVNFSF